MSLKSDVPPERDGVVGEQQPMHPHGFGFPAHHDHGGTGEQHAGQLPSFEGKGEGAPTTLDGIRASRLPVDDAVRLAAEALGSAKLAVFPAIFEVPLVGVEGEVADPGRMARFVGDAVAQAAGGASGIAGALEPLPPEEAFAFLWQIARGGNGSGNGARAGDDEPCEGCMRLLVDTLLGDRGFEFVRRVRVDGAGGPPLDGAIAISRGTGRVRVLALRRT